MPPLMTTPPVKVLLPESVQVLVPDLVSEPLAVPMTPVTVLPPDVPDSVRFCALLALIAGSVTNAVVGLNVVPMISVTGPNTTPGAPPLTFAPAAIVSVEPTVSDPSVCVMPALAEVALSDKIVPAEFTVRL